jgi:hypothetical protein
MEENHSWSGSDQSLQQMFVLSRIGYRKGTDDHSKDMFFKERERLLRRVRASCMEAKSMTLKSMTLKSMTLKASVHQWHSKQQFLQGKPAKKSSYY